MPLPAAVYPSLAASGSLPGHTRAKDKVTLTAYEALRDPAAPAGRDEALLSNCSLSLVNGAALTADTPNVKKRHRRVKSSGVRSAADDADSDGYEFSVVSLDNKVWHFEAGSQEERDEWVAVIEQQILTSLQVGRCRHRLAAADAGEGEMVRAAEGENVGTARAALY